MAAASEAGADPPRASGQLSPSSAGKRGRRPALSPDGGARHWVIAASLVHTWKLNRVEAFA
jgi:hypothetical protein